MKLVGMELGIVPSSPRLLMSWKPLHYPARRKEGAGAGGWVGVAKILRGQVFVGRVWVILNWPVCVLL